MFFRIPIKWSNPFLPWDQKDLSEKYTQEVLTSCGIDIDIEFLKCFKKDCETSNSDLQRQVPDFCVKIELKKIFLNIHNEFLEACKLQTQNVTPEILDQRRAKINKIRVYQDIMQDILNYFRLYPESVLAYQRRLMEATIERDKETELIKQ